ncbi:MAG: multidrug efflux RND transporter permease subunit, partial [Proteobacteria bacterium]
MARFFIDRPIFAWVISLGIILAGILSLKFLPIEQYPDIAPPTVEITSVYPGASARTVEEAVTTLIERELNGAPGLKSINSSSAANLSTITVTFNQGTDIDLAAVEVQNRLKTVESRLPEIVRRQGVKVEKVSNSFAMIVTLSSSDKEWGESQLGELATSVVLEPLRRVPGVGKVQQFGTESAMRIWPDPAKLASMSLTAADLSSTLRIYSNRVTVGALGTLGVPESAPISANMTSESPYKTAEDFGSIPLRMNSDGSAIRIHDIARVEVGAAEYGTSGRLNGKPVSGLAVKLAPGSNAIETADLIRSMMKKLERRLPRGVKYEIPFET